MRHFLPFIQKIVIRRTHAVTARSRASSTFTQFLDVIIRTEEKVPSHRFLIQKVIKNFKDLLFRSRIQVAAEKLWDWFFVYQRFYLFFFKHRFKILPLGSYTQMRNLFPRLEAALEVFNRYGLQHVRYSLWMYSKVPKWRPLRTFLSLRRRKKSLGQRSGEEGWGTTEMPFEFKNSVRKRAV